MAKYSLIFKLKVVTAYLNGEGGYEYLTKKYGVKLTPDQARILELEKQLRYAQIENAYLKELRRLRLEDARKIKEQQESLAVSEENSN